MEEIDILNEEVKKIHKCIQNCNKCSNVICRTPILGDRYDKYKIMVIGQNPLLGDYKSNNMVFGYKKQPDYNSYRHNWIQSFNSDTPIKVLNFINECLFNQKAINKAEIIRNLDYVLYSNIIKMPSKSEVSHLELKKWFENCKLLDDKFIIDYEIGKFKPKVILVIGMDTLRLMVNNLNLDPKTNIFYRYKHILTIPFYHVSHGWWKKKETKDKLEEKKKLIRKELGIKENLRE